MKGERQKFLEEEWPRVHATIQRLGLDAAELLATPPAVGFDVRPGAAAGPRPLPEADPLDAADDFGDPSDDKNS
jgi:hypothetical protein